MTREAIAAIMQGSRSPHGERGLKFGDLAPEKAGEKVALLTESVD